jgi:hypothetical protein
MTPKRFTIICFVIAFAVLAGLLVSIPAYGEIPDPTTTPQIVATITPPMTSETPHIPTIAELTPAVLSAIVAALLSISFRYVPGARQWFEGFTSDQKQTFMFVVTVSVALIIGAINIARDGLTEATVLTLLITCYTALTANQTTYQFIKPSRGR